MQASIKELAAKDACDLLFEDWPEDEESWVPEEIRQKGESHYQRLRERLEGEKGKYFVIDVKSGTYAIDADHVAAFDHAQAKSPTGAVFYSIRIGYDDLGMIGDCVYHRRA